MEAMEKAFETIALAEGFHFGAGSARLGFLSDSDNITMNRERVLPTDMESCGRNMSLRNRAAISRAGQKLAAFGKDMRQGEYISDHEVKIATKVAAEVFVGQCDPQGRR